MAQDITHEQSANRGAHGAIADADCYRLLDMPSKVEYALLALLELASRPARSAPLTIGEIAAKQPVPERYLEQILTNLRRGGIVQSQRGSRGGFVLTREPWNITVLEIVSLVEGDRKERESTTIITTERDLVWEIWRQASQAAQDVLSGYTLQDLCQRRDARQQMNPMYYI